MSKFSTVKIKCESPELQAAFMQVMLTSKAQLVSFLGQSLGSQGISSDIKMVIAGDEVTITQKSGDKGKVFVLQGDGYGVEVYSELPDFSKYWIVRDGGVSLYVKTPDNVDAHLGRFIDFDEVVANVNSNDVVDAVSNIQKKYTPTPQEENVVEELGDTREII